jgi:hypothetical protein
MLVRHNLFIPSKTPVFFFGFGLMRIVLLLLLESRLADVAAAELDVEHALHGGEHLLVGRRRAALKVGHDGRRGVALGRELLLGEGLGLEVGARLGDGVPDVLAYRLGLDDVVGSVDHCEALAFDGGLGGLGCVSLGDGRRELRTTYGVASGELLLCAHDLAGALGGVEGRFTLDHGLARRSAAAADVLADLDIAGIEISHLERFGGGLSVV